MISKLFFLFSLAIFSHTVFSQNSTAEQRPQAYLLSSGDTRPAISRPRRVSTDTVNDYENKGYELYKDSTLERQVFDLINERRVQSGLFLLEWSDDIAKMARQHSENMAHHKFFSHTDLKGLMVNDRDDAYGIKKWQAIGENIAYNRGYENPAVFAVERWMQSPSHRENLLSSRWKESGIGIAVTADGTYYFTEVFLSRK